MSMSQVRLAFSTMMSCLCETDEKQAYACIDALCEAISAIPNPAPLSSSRVTMKASTQTTSANADQAQGDLSALTQEDGRVERIEAPGAAVDNLVEDPTTRLEEASVGDELERLALRSPRGHLLIVLIDQASSVTEDFLDHILERIQWFLGEEANSLNAGGVRQMESRHALYEILFKTVATGMDMTKRQDASKWFLKYRQDAEYCEKKFAKL